MPRKKAQAPGPATPSDGVSKARAEKFRGALLDWYGRHARDLPWRHTREPYAIWVSEIMLQQTRVAAVLEHYAVFLKRFPSLLALALAPEEEVLALWSGLGYYRRARMLHKAAQFVTRELRGALPTNAAELRKLPGVGEYTAAAIASIAFGEPVAVVDGNVERVVTRLMALKPAAGEPAAMPARIRAVAGRLLEVNRPGDFNQAMMDLGATVCLPQRPLCLNCPVHSQCRTRGEHATLPRQQMRSQQIAYALVRRGGRAQSREVLLEQRPAGASLMAGMWELPRIDDFAADPARQLLALRHAITQTNYYVKVVGFTEDDLAWLPETAEQRRWVPIGELGQLPLTGLARKALKRLRVLPSALHPGAIARPPDGPVV